MQYPTNSCVPGTQMIVSIVSGVVSGFIETLARICRPASPPLGRRDRAGQSAGLAVSRAPNGERDALGQGFYRLLSRPRATRYRLLKYGASDQKRAENPTVGD